MSATVYAGWQKRPISAKLQIRTATRADVPSIFALATSLFGTKQFLYTIYQSPLAQRYLEKRVVAASRTNPFFILEVHGKFIGYYEAIVGETNCFLNYIGIAKSSAGNGYGTRLLTHYGRLARDCGRTELALEVFESNERALRWYDRLGFTQKGARYLTRLEIANVADNGMTASLNTAELQAALQEEAVSGFSKVVCDVGQYSILLGLIGGHSCKLLHHSGLHIDTAIQISASLMAGKRQVLIVSSPERLCHKLPVLSAETVLQMGKTLD